MSYTIVEAEYEIKDMLHFDGECIDVWVDKDLRRRAQEDGYIIADTKEEDPEPGPHVYSNLQSDKRADGTVIYKAKLHSSDELTRRGVE